MGCCLDSRIAARGNTKPQTPRHLSRARTSRIAARISAPQSTAHRFSRHPVSPFARVLPTMSAADAKVLKTEPLDPKDARWVRLVKTVYTDPLSKTRDWESAERQTRPAGSIVDGVGIAAILQGEGYTKPALLLQKQFRPPVDKVCIEVPAGLIDPNETPEQCALRELKEETGYVGQVVKEGFGVSPVMFNDPGFCNTNLNMVHVTIDMNLPENKNPKPQLEENEFIECFTVPLADLYAECRALEQQGYAIDARVGTLAEGIEISKRWKLFS